MKSSKKLFKNLKSHQLLVILAVIVGGYFLYTYSKSKGGSLDSYAEMNNASEAVSGGYEPSRPMGQNGDHGGADGMNTNMQGLPPSCVKQDVTDPRDLLPRGAGNEFSKLNPQGSGDLQNVSLLEAGTLNGINTVGTSVVLTMAEAMFDIPTRRGIVFCLWSSEEGGKRGSIAWVEDIPNEVTISNYINIDMGGVNWPGNGTPSDRVGPDGTGSYPASQENWPFRVYIGPDTEEDVINQPKMVYLAEWLAGDALGVEEQLAVLNGELNNAWSEAGEPGIIINEATTARSDHASFQAIDTVTVGFGGLVDGYDCYHQTCDTIDEMLYWMENDYASGMQNLINSVDLMTWYGTMIFLHLDHQPILNSYL